MADLIEFKTKKQIEDEKKSGLDGISEEYPVEGLEEVSYLEGIRMGYIIDPVPEKISDFMLAMMTMLEISEVVIETEEFVNDYAVSIEMVKAVYLRSIGEYHPLQDALDYIIGNMWPSVFDEPQPQTNGDDPDDTD